MCYAYSNNTLENTPPEYRDVCQTRNFASRGLRAKKTFQKFELQSPVENTLSQGELERRQEVENAVRKIVRIIISGAKS